LSWIGKEWTEGNLSGQATYTEIIYPLAAVLSAPTTSAIISGSVYTYGFTTTATGPDSPRTFSVEHGENNNYNKVTGIAVNEVGLSFTRDQVELSGSAFGRALVNNASSMTTVTYTPAAVMLLPADVSIYWDTTFAGITGSTPPSGKKLDRVLSVDWSIGDRFNPVWVLDAAQDSYVASVEGEPSLQATVMMEADAEGMARLAEMQASTTVFMRINATSSTAITGNVYYGFDLYMAGKVSDTGGYSDQDGLYAIEWTVTGIYDSTFNGTGGVVKVDVVNNIPYSQSGLNLV
jgi:hypothetical protein